MSYGGCENVLKKLKMSFETAKMGEVGYYIDVRLEYIDIQKKVIAIIPRLQKCQDTVFHWLS